MKRKLWKTAGCLMICASVLTGCGLGGLKEPYDLTSRADFYSAGLGEEEKAGVFAEKLCVVEDEGSYDFGEMTAEAAAVFGVDDHTVLYSKNSFEQLYPASITKVMTALLAIKYGDLNDSVTVPEESVITESGATMCGIAPGDVLTMEQLLYGLMLPSGNDAGAAIAVHMAGDLDKFSEMMNQEAARLGATGTHFVNPHGLNDEQHYTTAYDLYLIFNEALKQPKFCEIIKTSSYTADYRDRDGNPLSKTWTCSNRYITGKEPLPEGVAALGGKTGTTKAAGNCLIMGSEDASGRRYISVVLKADGQDNLYQNMTNLIHKIVE